MNNGRVAWLTADDPPDHFPPVDQALTEPDGLLAAGGDLSAERLLHAYRNGIFPWYDDGQPLLWWSPDPRCVFLPGDFKLSRRATRELRNSGMQIRLNSAFSDVIRACAGPRKSGQGTWITPAIICAFEDLHRSGWAHSIEVWHSNRLVGGLYGLRIGKAFFGESMFSHRRSASKLALLFLSRRLQAGDIDLLDCQVVSDHLMRMGARTLARKTFVNSLPGLCEAGKALENWTNAPIVDTLLFAE